MKNVLSKLLVVVALTGLALTTSCVSPPPSTTHVHMPVKPAPKPVAKPKPKPAPKPAPKPRPKTPSPSEFKVVNDYDKP